MDLSKTPQTLPPQKSQYLSGTAGQYFINLLSLLNTILSGSRCNTEHSPLLSDLGRPPTLICQQEKLFLSQLCRCASVCKNISALPLFLWRANEMKLLSSVNCFRLWLAVVGGEIAFLSPSPLLSLSRSLFFPFSPSIQPLLFG